MPEVNPTQDKQPKRQANDAKQAQQFQTYVVNLMNKGKRKADIIQDLTHQGVDAQQAEELISREYDDILSRSQAEQFAPGDMVPSIVGGLLSAIIGGVLWGLLVKFTGYEIGYAAIGIGALSGYGIVLFNQGKKGRPVQIIAGVSSVFGILCGKFCQYYFQMQAFLVQEYGEIVKDRVSPLSEGMLEGFVESLMESARDANIIYDLFWVGLAVTAAVKITKGTGLKHTQDLSAQVQENLPIGVSPRRNLSLTVLGIVIIVLLFSLISSPKKSFIQENFENLTMEDVEFVITTLKKSEDTTDYFNIIDEKMVHEITKELHQFISAHPDKNDFLGEIERIKKDFESLALGLAAVDFPDDFYGNTAKYPDLEQALYLYTLQEFQISLYRSFYLIYGDNDYEIILSDEANTAIDKIYEVFGKMQ